MAELMSLRKAYGDTLVELGKTDKDIVVLEADLGMSTMGQLFQEPYPTRFFEMGISEANMASVAAGLALTGKKAFMASFAVFSTGRCYDQIRTSICLPNVNVKICGSSAGFSDFGDGSTHQSIEDIATMRALPNMQVFSPVDAHQVESIVQHMAKTAGPMYIRINRNDLPVLTQKNKDFIPGKVYTVRDGRDAVVFASGVMVSLALEAAAILEEESISLRVVNVPSIKPLDAEEVAGIAADVKGVVTAEEHSVIGGLGSAITEALAPRIAKKVFYVGVEDTFGTSAQNYEVLLQHYNLTPQHIAEKVRLSIKG